MEQGSVAPTWVVVRTFNRKELDVSTFLKEKSVPHFIPMTYREKLVSGKDRPQRVLTPVIHNYVFMEKVYEEAVLRSLLAECRVPLQLMRNRGEDKICEISDREMMEFRMICDPDYSRTPAEFLEADDAEALPGREVEVVHGQFKGIRGKLYKKNQKYWFIKTVGVISVMIRISRWYCKVVDENSK